MTTQTLTPVPARPIAAYVGVDMGVCDYCDHGHHPGTAINGYWCGYALDFNVYCDCTEYALRLVKNGLCLCGHLLDTHDFGTGQQACDACECVDFLAEPERYVPSPEECLL